MKFVIVLSFLAILTTSQKTLNLDQVRKDLQSVKTSEQARAYLSKSGIEGDLLELDESSDSSAIAIKLFKTKTGALIEQTSANNSGTYIYKVLTSDESEADRVQYIYFDNTKLTKNKIDSLRVVIMKRIKNGETFGALAKQYSMDPNGKRGGDSEWFDKEIYIASFVSAVRAHKKGDVFPVDIPAKKWYYVVRKSHDPIKRKKIVAFYVAVPSK